MNNIAHTLPVSSWVNKPCGRAVFVNGILNVRLSDLDHLPDGCSVSSHGTIIDVKPGATIDLPLEVIFLSTLQPDTPACHTHRFIHLGEGASLKLYESKVSQANTPASSTHMNSITLDKGAMLEHIVLEEHSPTSLTFLHDDVMLHEHATFKKTALHLGGKETHHKTTLDLNGNYAFASLGGLSYTTGNSTTNVVVGMRHNAPYAQSRQVIRSMATDKSRAVFQGNIIVAPHAQKTDASQNHQGLLLSDTAEIDAKPSLEIFADDVTCSHGNTCGALDETSLFYLRSRGIPRMEAEQLLQQAFIAELFEAFDEPLKETLVNRISMAMKREA